MKDIITLVLRVFIFLLTLMCFMPLHLRAEEPSTSIEKVQQTSDHFDGTMYFNPNVPQPPPTAQSQEKKRSYSRWIWKWLFGNDWPKWTDVKDVSPGPPPLARVPEGALYVTPIGHSTFLIQIDGFNILIDPIWSERCSPVSWAGPKRYREPGIRFEDLPSIDIVLISHNHYDHLDLPTLKRLAEKGTPRAIVTFGNRDLIREAGFTIIHELDWWQSVSLSQNVVITLVPAQHFSSRTLWDRNKTLWGGFVISGPSGNVLFSGDTGYGSHFKEIARLFSPIQVALLPISPFLPQQSNEPPLGHFSSVHMGPKEAIAAHMDLGAQVSIAAHFQVFRLGPDGFNDAADELALTLKDRNLNPDTFITPILGQSIKLNVNVTGICGLESFQNLGVKNNDSYLSGGFTNIPHAVPDPHLQPPQICSCTNLFR